MKVAKKFKLKAAEEESHLVIKKGNEIIRLQLSSDGLVIPDTSLEKR